MACLNKQSNGRRVKTSIMSCCVTHCNTRSIEPQVIHDNFTTSSSYWLYEAAAGLDQIDYSYRSHSGCTYMCTFWVSTQGLKRERTLAHLDQLKTNLNNKIRVDARESSADSLCHILYFDPSALQRVSLQLHLRILRTPSLRSAKVKRGRECGWHIAAAVRSQPCRL